MPRNTRIRPACVSARKMSPLGAIRSNRGLFSPDAKRFTWNPAGAIGHTSAGRDTSSAPLTDDFVTNGCGKSLTVIFRIVPGFSNRKSVNGAGGGGALIVLEKAAEVVAGGGASAAAAVLDAVPSV